MPTTEFSAIYEELKLLTETLTKNPNRVLSSDILNEKEKTKLEVVKRFNKLVEEFNENDKTRTEETSTTLKHIRTNFLTLLDKFDNSIKTFRSKVNTMAIATDKVIDLFSKIFPNEYDGNPLKLDQTIKILKVVKTTFTAPENQKQIISLIQLKLVAKASENLPETINSVDEIIAILQNNCKGQSSRQIVATLEGTACVDRVKYTQNLRDFSQKLHTSYINEGVRRDTVNTYVIDDLTKNIKKNFITNPVMVAAMNQSFTSVDDLIHRFESVQIDKQASVMAFRQHYHNARNFSNNFNRNNFNNNRGRNRNFFRGSNNKRYNQNNKRYNVKTIATEVQENSLDPCQ